MVDIPQIVHYYRMPPTTYGVCMRIPARPSVLPIYPVVYEHTCLMCVDAWIYGCMATCSRCESCTTRFRR